MLVESASELTTICKLNKKFSLTERLSSDNELGRLITVYVLYPGSWYFQEVIHLQGTRVNVISFYAKTKITTFPMTIFVKLTNAQQNYVQMDNKCGKKDSD